VTDQETAAATDELDERALVGRVLGERYHVDGLIGTGGMGAVYRGHHVTLKRPVAIKVLASQVSDRPDMVKRFAREAQAVSMLDHPHCVQILDYGTTDDGIQFLVMQLLHGVELRDLLHAPIALDRALTFAGQILLALEHAHRRGIVHRDLKPENVFIVRDDEGQEIVKLVDFGVVKLLGDENETERLTRAGIVFGTPMYMSPEQAAGAKVDGRSDLYAVGILLYEMLVGVPPFMAEDPTLVARMQLVSEPPPLPPHVPPPIRDVIMRLLKKTRDERYASAREAKDALDAAAELLQPSASGVTAVGRETMDDPRPDVDRVKTAFYHEAKPLEGTAPPPANGLAFEPPGGRAPAPLPSAHGGPVPAFPVPGEGAPAAQGAPFVERSEAPTAPPERRVALVRKRRATAWTAVAWVTGGVLLWGIVWLAMST